MNNCNIPSDGFSIFSSNKYSFFYPVQIDSAAGIWEMIAKQPTCFSVSSLDPRGKNGDNYWGGLSENSDIIT